MKPINQMTLKELKKEEMDLSEDLHFQVQRGERIRQEDRIELDALRSRIQELELERGLPLRKERIKLGLSMSECARRADVPFRTWQKWELGTRRTPEMAFKLLKGIESNIY